VVLLIHGSSTYIRVRTGTQHKRRALFGPANSSIGQAVTRFGLINFNNIKSTSNVAYRHLCDNITDLPQINIVTCPGFRDE
jgi:hypothetical protein